MNKTAPSRQEYPQRGRIVNGSRQRLRGAVFLALLAASMAGCAAPIAVRSTTFVLAARCCAADPIAGSLRQADALPSREALLRLRTLGFEQVVLSRRPGESVSTLATAAAEGELAVLLADPDLDFFVRTGLGSIRGGSVRAGLQTIHREIVAHSAAMGVVVCGAPGAEAVRRWREVRTEAELQGLAIFLSSDQGDGATDAPLVHLSLAAGNAEAAGTATEACLQRYHAGLLAGQTGGVVISLPMTVDAGSQGDVGEPRLSAGEAAAVQGVLTRARAWRPHLAGATRIGLPEPVASGERPSACAFANGTRRYVLLVNPSVERYLRTTATIPPGVLDGAFIRAVEVADAVGRLPGRVHPLRGGVMQLPVELRPGDAVLFELF